MATKHKDQHIRLQTLKRQLYGKEPLTASIKKIKTSSHEEITSNPQSNTLAFINKAASQTQIHTQTSGDLTYLYQDLRKIIILSTLAIGFQLILYFFALEHLVNLNLHF